MTGKTIVSDTGFDELTLQNECYKQSLHRNAYPLTSYTLGCSKPFPYRLTVGFRLSNRIRDIHLPK